MNSEIDFPALKPADLEILLALSQQDLHGYGLMKEVEHRSEGRVVLELGSLYRLIARLEKEGMISSVERGEDLSDDGRRRKYYRLTELGRRALKAEARRLESLMEVLQAQRLVDSEGTR